MSKKKSKEIFNKYKIYKFRLTKAQESFNYLQDEIAREDLEKKMRSWQKYTDFIDEIFNQMDNENAKFLKRVYIENSKKEDFYYCDSTFYWKLNKAISEFSSYVEI